MANREAKLVKKNVFTVVVEIIFFTYLATKTKLINDE
jgi:hypothetical protein